MQILAANPDRLAGLAKSWFALLLSHPRCFGSDESRFWETALCKAFAEIVAVPAGEPLAEVLDRALLNKLDDPRCQAGLLGTGSSGQYQNDIGPFPIRLVDPEVLLIDIPFPQGMNKPANDRFIQELDEKLRAHPKAALLIDLRWDDHDLDFVDPALLELLTPEGEIPSAWRRVHRGWNEDFNPYVYEQSWEVVPLHPKVKSRCINVGADRPMVLVVNRSSIAILGYALLAWKSTIHRHIVFEKSGRFASLFHDRFVIEGNVIVNIPRFHVPNLITAVFEKGILSRDTYEKWSPEVLRICRAVPAISFSTHPFPFHVSPCPSGPRDSMEPVSPGECFTVVAKLWGVLRHFSPVFQRSQGEDPAWFLSKLSRLASAGGLTRGFLGELVREVAAALPDNHAQVFFPWLAFGKIPIQFLHCEGRVVVRQAPCDSTLVPGDVVECVDERSTADFLRTEPALNGASTDQFRLHSACTAICRPPGDHRRRLRVDRAGTSIEATFPSTSGEKLDSPDVSMLRNADVFSPAWSHTFELVSERIALLRPFDLEQEAWLDEIFSVIDGRADGLILDLRGYPRRHFHLALARHLTTGPISFPAYDLPLVPGTGRNGRRVERRFFEAPASQGIGIIGKPFLGPLVGLIDERTISAAEFTGLLLRYNREIVFVGRPSAGNCGNAAFIRLPGGLAFSFTGMDFFDPEGKLFEGRGLIPDIPVEPTISGLREGRDELLDRAVAELRKKIG